MALKDQIMADLKAAMKAKDVATRDALRMLKTAITEAEIAKGSVDEAAALDIVKKAVKTRRESAAQYEEAQAKNGEFLAKLVNWENVAQRLAGA